jgi:hypothetical protein
MKRYEKYNGRITHSILLLSFLFLSQSSCGGGGGSNSTSVPQQPSESELAAIALLRSISVSTDAEVSFFGPVLPGTVIREAGPLGESTADQSGQNRDSLSFTKRLDIPLTSGKYYVFFINDEPIFRFAHPVRYIWVNLNTMAFGQVSAQWWPLIEEPGVGVALFSKEKATVVSGVRFFFGKKSGIVSPNPNKNILEDLAAPIRGGTGDSSITAKKIAVVIDGGGDADHVMSSDADRFANEFLSPRGFTVKRISQYSGNSHPYLPVAPAGTGDAVRTLQKLFKGYADLMKPCPDDGTCHEFFLYIVAHGLKGDINIHSTADASKAERIVSSSEASIFPGLKQILSVFDKNCVKLIVFLDICNSGAIIPDLQTLCEGRPCGVTIITAAEATKETPAGEIVDSATQDFLEDVGDLDNDGKKGDLGDRVQWMRTEGKKWGNPQLMRCPEGTPLCSTD